MTAQPPEPPDAGADLEYDLAHDAEDAAKSPCGPRSPGSVDLVQVELRDDYDGDYGYDLAHDVPGRRTPPS